MGHDRAVRVRSTTLTSWAYRSVEENTYLWRFSGAQESTRDAWV
jgi:hypothetical protein